MGQDGRHRQLAAAIDRDIAAGRAIAAAGVKVVEHGRDRVAFAWPVPEDVGKVEGLQRLSAAARGAVESTAPWDVALPMAGAGRSAPTGSARLAVALSRQSVTVGSAVVVFRLPDHCEALAAMYDLGALAIYAREPIADDDYDLPHLGLVGLGHAAELRRAIGLCRRGISP